MWETIRYRRLQALTIALLAALITTCAVFAPLYDRAMQQALVRIKLDAASQAVRGLQVSATPADGSFLDTSPTVGSPQELAGIVPGSVRRSFGHPIGTMQAQVTRQPETPSSPSGMLLSRDDLCAHIRVVSGRCPQKQDEIVVSPADVHNFGVTVGSDVTVAGAPVGGTTPRVPRFRLRVVGTYRQPSDSYWFGADLTGFSGQVDLGPPVRKRHDTWLTARSTFTTPGTPVLVQPTNSADFPLDVPHTGVDQLLTLGPALTRLNSRVHRGDTGVDGVVDTYSGLPGIASEVRHQKAQSRITVPLLMVQLGLLAVIVLWLVLGAATEQRRPEIAVAMLRGRGTRGARSLLLRELLPVALAGVPVGAAAALLLSWLARGVLLPGSAPFELGIGPVLALAAALLVILAATALAVRQISREPVERLLRRVPVRRTGWSLGALEAVVIAASGTAVVAFVTGGLTGPIALAAPSLLAVVVGLLLAHATTPATALLGRSLLARGRVGAGISVLDAARTPATRRTVAIVTVASALLVFSMTAVVVGAHNRDTAAQQEAGAPMRVEVSGDDLAGVRAAIREVDPTGRTLTPVVSVQPPDGDAQVTTAVVPSQFNRIALFPDSGAHVDARALAPPKANPIRLRGDRLTVRVTSQSVSSHGPGQASPDVSLQLDLIYAAGDNATITLGKLPLGVSSAARTYRRHISCSAGCYLSGISIETLPSATVSGNVVLGDLTTSGEGDTATPVALVPASAWSKLDDRADGRMVPTAKDGRLSIEIGSSGHERTTMTQAWIPARVPALVAGPLPSGSSGNAFLATGLDAQERDAVRVGRLARIPASGPRTGLFNLDVLSRGSDTDPADQVSVWFAHEDRAELTRLRTALRSHDMRVARTVTLTDTRRGYDESIAAWSLALGVVVGIAGLLIAILVVVVLAVTTWRSRSRDLAALRMTGVARSSLRVVATLAQLPALVIAVVAGTVCGVVGAHFALPSVPLFASSPLVSTRDLSIPWIAVLAAAAVALAVLLLVGWAAGTAIARRAALVRLRESQ